jgi:uncharacterized membrane protein YadS
MAVVRSVGDAGLAGGGRALGTLDASAWKSATKTAGETWASAALATAMAGVGLSTNFRSFRQMGMKPLYVGALSAALVASLALALAAAFGPRVLP